VSLVATVAGPNSNSYLTVTEADAYFTGRSDTSNWDALSTSDKEALLIQSTKDVDIGANYGGEPYYDAQKLQFPRDDADSVEGNCASVANDRFKHSDLKSDTYMEIPNNFYKYGSIHFTSATLENQVYAIASSNTSGFVFASFSATPTTTTQFIVFPPIDKDIKDAVCEQAYSTNEYKLGNYAEMRALGLYNVRIGDVSVTTRIPREPSSVRTPVLCLKARRLISRFSRGSVDRVARA